MACERSFFAPAQNNIRNKLEVAGAKPSDGVSRGT
jgi:hypothetical protein